MKQIQLLNIAENKTSPLCKHHAMKAYRKSDCNVKIYEEEEEDWLTLRFGRFLPRARTHVTHTTGKWVIPHNPFGCVKYNGNIYPY
jgi:hypothetical protein